MNQKICISKVSIKFESKTVSMGTISNKLLLKQPVLGNYGRRYVRRERENRKKKRGRKLLTQQTRETIQKDDEGKLGLSSSSSQNKGEGRRVVEERPFGNHKAPDMLGHLENVIGGHFTDPLEDMGGK